MSRKSIKELNFEARDLIGLAEFDRRIRSWLMRQLRVLNREPTGESKGKFDQQREEIIGELNRRCNSRYRENDETKRIIRYWISKGRTVEDFHLVDVHRITKWRDDPLLRDYIRPSTLYRKSHFDESQSELTETEQERHEREMKTIRDLAAKKRVPD